MKKSLNLPFCLAFVSFLGAPCSELGGTCIEAACVPRRAAPIAAPAWRPAVEEVEDLIMKARTPLHEGAQVSFSQIRSAMRRTQGKGKAVQSVRFNAPTQVPRVAAAIPAAVPRLPPAGVLLLRARLEARAAFIDVKKPGAQKFKGRAHEKLQMAVARTRCAIVLSYIARGLEPARPPALVEAEAAVQRAAYVAFESRHSSAEIPHAHAQLESTMNAFYHAVSSLRAGGGEIREDSSGAGGSENQPASVRQERAARLPSLSVWRPTFLE